MTIEELKDSDKLNLYILGLLPENEIQEVEELLVQNPGLLVEYNETQDALLSYATEHSQTPPPALKAKVLKGIEDLSKQHQPAIKGGDASALLVNKSFNWYSIAASILLVVSVGLTYMLVQKNAKIDDLTARIAANDTQLAESNTQFSSLKSTLNAMYSNDMQQVRLKSTDTTKEVYATFFYDKASKQLLVHQGNLEKRDDGMQYQVWALIDGKPYSAGVFDAETSADSLKVINTNLDAQLFAVSIEKQGGAETPTPERIILISNRI